MTEHIVATVDEVPEDGVIGVEVDGIEIAIFRVGEEFYAMQNRCIHRNAQLHRIGGERINEEDCLTEGPGNINGSECSITCPRHEWKFDLKTGDNTTSKQRMRTFDVSTEGQNVKIKI